MMRRVWVLGAMMALGAAGCGTPAAHSQATTWAVVTYNRVGATESATIPLVWATHVIAAEDGAAVWGHIKANTFVGMALRLARPQAFTGVVGHTYHIEREALYIPGLWFDFWVTVPNTPANRRLAQRIAASWRHGAVTRSLRPNLQPKGGN